MTQNNTKLSKKRFIENIRILADTFLHLAEACPEDEVNMVQPRFHPCGTIACHAGHFALARGLEETINYAWQDSATDMAKFLGFESKYNLPGWASANPELWGNPYGLDMFGCKWAFGKVRNETLTLTDIGLHWHGVADRVEAT